MSEKKSDKLNAALAASIKAMPVEVARATLAELRASGLEDEAAEYEAVLIEREKALSEARAAKEAEEAAVHAAAVEKARAEYEAVTAQYVKALDESFEHLARYVDVARPAANDYTSVHVAYQRVVALLGPNSPDLPELPPAPGSYAKTGPFADRLKGISL